MTATRLRALVDWAYAHGVKADKIEVRMSVCEDEGYTFTAKSRIEPNDVIARVPVHLALTWRRARNSPVGQALLALNRARRNRHPPTVDPASYLISSRTIFYVYIIHELVHADSFFGPYLRALPTTFDDPLWWTPDDLEAIRGTNLFEAVPRKWQQLAERYHRVFPDAFTQYPDLFQPSDFTIERFQWVNSLYLSRGYPGLLAEVPSSTPSSASTSSSTSASSNGGLVVYGSGVRASSSTRAPRLGCLLPFVDLMNHRYAASITWIAASASADTQSAPADAAPTATATTTTTTSAHTAPPPPPSIVFRCGSNASYETNEEVFNNYGAKSNDSFLLGYGFVIADNPHDTFTVQIGGVSPSQARVLDAVGIAWRNVGHQLRKDALPDDLLRTLRVCAMDDADHATFATRVMLMGEENESAAADASTDEASTAATATTRSPIARAIDLSQPLNPRNELTALNLLESLLLSRLRRLRATSIEHAHECQRADRAMLASNSTDASSPSTSTPLTYHQRLGIQFRVGQRDVLLCSLAIVHKRQSSAAREAHDLVTRLRPQLIRSDPSLAAATLAAATPAAGGTVAPAPALGTTSRVTSHEAAAEQVFRLLAWLKTNSGSLDVGIALAHPTSSEAGTDELSAPHLSPAASCVLVAAQPSSDGAPSSTPAAAVRSHSLALRIPRQLLITVESVHASRTFRRAVDLAAGLRDDQLIALFLLHERSRGDKSTWHPFFEALRVLSVIPSSSSSSSSSAPSSSSSQDDDARPQHSVRARCVYELVDELTDLHAQLFPALTDAAPRLFPAHVYTLDAFIWAYTVVLEHSLVGVVVPPTRNAASSSASSIVVLPLVPMPLASMFPTVTASFVASSTQSGRDGGRDGGDDSVLEFCSVHPLTHGQPITFDYRSAFVSASDPSTDASDAIACCSAMYLQRRREVIRRMPDHAVLPLSPELVASVIARRVLPTASPAHRAALAPLLEFVANAPQVSDVGLCVGARALSAELWSLCAIASMSEREVLEYTGGSCGRSRAAVVATEASAKPGDLDEDVEAEPIDYEEEFDAEQSAREQEREQDVEQEEQEEDDGEDEEQEEEEQEEDRPTLALSVSSLCALSAATRKRSRELATVVLRDVAEALRRRCAVDEPHEPRVSVLMPAADCGDAAWTSSDAHLSSLSEHEVVRVVDEFVRAMGN